MKIILVGCKRFNQNGELFLDKDNGGNPEIYEVPDARGNYLLKQFDPSTGFLYFDKYAGTEVGRTPGAIKDDNREYTEGRPMPKKVERKPRGERSGLRRPGSADAATANAPIEDSDAVIV